MIVGKLENSQVLLLHIIYYVCLNFVLFADQTAFMYVERDKKNTGPKQLHTCMLNEIIKRETGAKRE